MLVVDEHVDQTTAKKSLVVTVYDRNLEKTASSFCYAFDKAFEDSWYQMLGALN